MDNKTRLVELKEQFQLDNAFFKALKAVHNKVNSPMLIKPNSFKVISVVMSSELLENKEQFRLIFKGDIVEKTIKLPFNSSNN